VGAEDVEMYGKEPLINNPSDQALELRIVKEKVNTMLFLKYGVMGSRSCGQPMRPHS
jgi:hypothetical protein